MKISKFVSVLFFTMLFCFLSLESEAQRSRKKSRSSRDRQETVSVPLKEKIFYNINIGNLFLGNGFSMSAKFNAGYKISDRFGVGMSAKSFLDIVQIINAPDVTIFSYGTGAFTRFKFTRDFFVQAEYNLTSYKNFDTTRKWYSYPMIGLGYESSSGGLWSYGMNVLFNLSEEVREVGANGFGEYWISFSYNF